MGKIIKRINELELQYSDGLLTQAEYLVCVKATVQTDIDRRIKEAEALLSLLKA